MKFFLKLENKYRKYAIRNLMFYIIGMYAIGFFVLQINPDFYFQYLALDAQAILRGQIWRVITFMIYPPSLSPLFLLLSLYVYFSLGTVLERAWGSFRFNVYFFIGIIGHVLAAFVGYFAFHEIWILTTTFLNFSIFFAYAMTFPDAQFYLMFVFPIKAKVLALFELAIYLYYFAFGNSRTRCEIILSLANVILFYVLTRDFRKFNPKEIKRKKNFQSQVKSMPQGKTHHKCAVCGKTEKDGDHLEFRYCSKCEGAYEYCSEHLYTHKHVVNDKESKELL